MVLGGGARRSHVVGVDHAVLVVDGDELDAGVQGRRAELVGDDVLAAPGHHRRSRSRQDAQRDLVRHDARGTNSAAGLPTRAANASSSARTVGSSP